MTGSLLGSCLLKKCLLFVLVFVIMSLCHVALYLENIMAEAVKSVSLSASEVAHVVNALGLLRASLARAARSAVDERIEKIHNENIEVVSAIARKVKA